MNNITKSASKLVLLYIIAILGLLSLFAGGYSVVTQTFGEASKIILSAFGVALNFVLGFYFGYKGDTTKNVPDFVDTATGERGTDTEILSQFTK